MALVFIDLNDSDAVKSLCCNVRYLLSLTITEDEISDETILREEYFSASAQEIALRLDFTDQASYNELLPDQQQRILTALEYRITAKLLGDLPKFLSQEKLKTGLGYDNWDITELKLIYLRLIEKELWEFRDLQISQDLELEDNLPKSDKIEEEVEEMAPHFVSLR